MQKEEPKEKDKTTEVKEPLHRSFIDERGELCRRTNTKEKAFFCLITALGVIIWMGLCLLVVRFFLMRP